MATTLTALDAEAIAEARTLLEKPPRPARMWPVLAAAGALAASALAFATVMITAPPLTTEHPGHARSIE